MIIPETYGNWITEYHFDGDSEAMITSCGVNLDGIGSSYQQALEALADNWVACLAGSMSENVEMGPSFLQVGHFPDDPVTFVYDSVTPGSAPNFPMWPNTAVLVRKQGDLGGRRNRGRMYIPGLALRTLVSPAGVIDSAFLADLQTNLTDFLDNLDSLTEPGPMTLVTLHSSGTPTPASITTLTAQPKLATQRRRLRP